MRLSIPLFELEGDLDFRLILPVLDGRELDAEFHDFDLVDVVERLLSAVDRVVDGLVEALGALADQCDLFVYHRDCSFDAHPQKITRR